jgi:4,5-DOPA dioxygenase extradiol
VVQVAVQPARGAAHHLALGQALAPLGAENVLVIGSGHTTHNLREFFVERGRRGASYATAFAQWVDDRIGAHDIDALVDYRERAPEAARAHPTDEHFLPIFVALGAAGEGARKERFLTGLEGGALALDSWIFHPLH